MPTASRSVDCRWVWRGKAHNALVGPIWCEVLFRYMVLAVVQLYPFRVVQESRNPQGYFESEDLLLTASLCLSPVERRLTGGRLKFTRGVVSAKL